MCGLCVLEGEDRVLGKLIAKTRRTEMEEWLEECGGTHEVVFFPNWVHVSLKTLLGVPGEDES